MWLKSVIVFQIVYISSFADQSYSLVTFLQSFGEIKIIKCLILFKPIWIYVNGGEGKSSFSAYISPLH